jgi:1-acyl-sn-glycerol-3-phosphate acyltransferase
MRTLVYFVLLIILAIFLIPLLLFCLLTRLSQPIIFFGKQGIRLGQKILGVKLDVCGVEKIDKDSAYIFMANHTSFIDGPLLFMLIPQPIRVLLKKEAFRIPVIGLSMKHVGFVPVDRKGLKGGRQSIEKASQLMKEKRYSFLIFPEGTRSRDGGLQPFKRGGFFLAINTQAPILPITIGGTFELMPRGSFFVKRGKIKVIFHEPVEIEGHDRDSILEISSKVRSVIQSGLMNGEKR